MAKWEGQRLHDRSYQLFPFRPFFLRFSRFVVELFSRFRNVFLIKISLILMVGSAGCYYGLRMVQDWALDHPDQPLPHVVVGLFFLAGAALVGGLFFAWLKRMK